MVVEFDQEFASPADYARLYRGLGVQVVPAHLPSEGGQWKRPFGDWLEFQDALAPDAVFARWYDPMTGEHRRRLNMGFVCGAASGGLLCVDLDHKDGSQAAAWWDGVLAVHLNGMEPDTWAQRTGGGGRQLFFRAPAGWSPPTFKTSIGVDIRGQGGFAMTPPSRHASGHGYEWEAGREPWAADLAEAPEGLIEAVEQLREANGPAFTAASEHTPSDAALNAVGLQVDDREHKLQVAVWGAVVDLYRESPIRPSEAEQKAERARLWANYEATTKSRLDGPQWAHLVNADRLELEGRGYSELGRKWAYAMRRWDSKVKAAAAEPRPNPPVVWTERTAEANTWGDKLGPTDPTPTPEQDPEPLDVATFTGQAPERQWLVPDWVVEGVVNSLYGPGGTGKSLIALQLAYAAISGGLWLGLPVKQGPVLAVFCEDDADELHRRHDAIRHAEGHALGNPYGGTLVWPRAGARNILVSWRREGPVLGIFHDRLKAAVEQHNPALLILDTISDVFGGEERDRAHVTFFLKEVLGGLIRHQRDRGHSLTILLLGHPSVSGKAQGGTGYSGSTAWENAVRSRLYLSKPDTGGQDERLLTRGKANYAASGDETGLKLIYDGGAFKSAGAHDERAVNLAKRRVTERVEWAWKAGAPYMERRSHPRNLHGLIGQELKREGFERSTVLEAIAEAIEEGAIRLSADTGKRGWRTANA